MNGRILCHVAVGVLLTCSVATAQSRLYGVSSEGNHDMSELYVINPTTGESSLIGVVGPDCGFTTGQLADQTFYMGETFAALSGFEIIFQV